MTTSAHPAVQACGTVCAAGHSRQLRCCETEVMHHDAESLKTYVIRGLRPEICRLAPLDQLDHHVTPPYSTSDLFKWVRGRSPPSAPAASHFPGCRSRTLAGARVAGSQRQRRRAGARGRTSKLTNYVDLSIGSPGGPGSWFGSVGSGGSSLGRSAEVMGESYDLSETKTGSTAQCVACSEAAHI